MISRLLVANRGEIAVRILRACRELGIESVAVYSTADARARHLQLADRAVEIGPPPASDSYLSIARLIDAARREDADAVHPGYGFLSENPEFAAACQDAGLTFVGPSADVISRMGSKIEARRAMAAAGVPVVPGETPADQTDEGLQGAARKLGLPLLVKASAGGGGKGMRIVRTEPELDESLQAARREALSAFGNGTMYCERLLDRPRHIEVQVFGDAHGQIVHLFERECSIQRRYQKMIEESPSTALTPAVRARMGIAAVAAARAVGYVNAGTVEFLVEGTGDQARYYFLEMNTRLQVEHPVTEMVLGTDLVQTQLLIAGGEPLPWRQDALQQRGHAIECRVYAEDPANDFVPQAGELLLYREPQAPGVRVDSGVGEGSEVPVYYDPLLAKLIVWHGTRSGAIRRTVEALREFAVLGVRTNLTLLRRVIEHPRFERGDVDVAFIESEPSLFGPVPEAATRAAVAAAASFCASESAGPSSSEGPRHDPWDSGKGGRS